MDFFNSLSEVMGLTKEQRVLVMRTGWVTLVSAHILWVCGWLAVIGLQPPFAHADTLTEVARALKEDRLERLDLAIQTVRSQQCRTAIDSPARQNYTDRLTELYRKYKEQAGVEPHVPRCDET